MRRIQFTVPGPAPRKNRRHRIVRGRMINSKRFTGWVGELWAAWAKWRPRSGPKFVADRGRWELRLYVYESKLRHLDVDVPHGDADSSVSCVKDGLMRIGVLDDDARIVRQYTEKHYDKANPHVLIVLEEVRDGE